jgi:hypothetical protein
VETDSSNMVVSYMDNYFGSMEYHQHCHGGKGTQFLPLGETALSRHSEP